MPKDLVDHVRAVHFTLLLLCLLLLGSAYGPSRRDSLQALQQARAIAAVGSDPQVLTQRITGTADWESKIYTPGYITPADIGSFRLEGLSAENCWGKCPDLRFEVKARWVVESSNAVVATFIPQTCKNVNQFRDLWDSMPTFIRVPELPPVSRSKIDATTISIPGFTKRTTAEVHITPNRTPTTPNCTLYMTAESGLVTPRMHCETKTAFYTVELPKQRTDQLDVSLRKEILGLLLSKESWTLRKTLPKSRSTMPFRNSLRRRGIVGMFLSQRCLKRWSVAPRVGSPR